ncbi:hypothetical protein GALL_255210 [mine drainage metagenome]|uniref:Uncharacterized protein n=1 Tax=mine drainage metagenome TaxID=410659 RepID=A0A1J5R9Q4_9ZZZZ
MMDGLELDGILPEEQAGFIAFSDKAVGTNINPQTLLATDYLNHFNEIIMMLEMIPDMPDCLEEAQAWSPKSYQDHFRDSQFRDRALAIEAYDHVPSKYRVPFEEVIGQMNSLVAASILRIAEVLEGGDADQLRYICSEASHGVQKLMDVASAVIHGSTKILVQSEIDGFLAH